ncbi:extracellular solute-binding protein [Frigidibacter sp. MR17.24]|uniref:extracellular solute-binding protein n=1 Tax=Frigidibacter sp. MR17.24 TaxID=3127345 RepID=UPI003FA60974
MIPLLQSPLRGLTAAAVSALWLACGAAAAAPSHGLAMYGAPALPAGFDHLPYANPDAPKGGRIVYGESGSFDSLNPWILKGRAPWGMGQHVAETMMVRSIDEPFTLYGLLAQSVEVPPDRSWVEFTLRPEARFSDGSPVTVEDVIWSYETLGTEGHPRYRTAWARVRSITSPGPGRVRIDFTEPDRELPLLMALRPVLKKAQWQDRDFTASTMEPPIGSGPYVVGAVDPGRSITFRRNPDWWAKDLPLTRGTQNLDEIRYEYFGDAGIGFEAFKAGAVDVWRETNAAKWARDYDLPAIAAGEVVKEEIPHHRPSGITGLAFNTRLPVFADWRVREALTLAFNYGFINRTINAGDAPRIGSYFWNSDLAAPEGPLQGRAAELLAPFAADLPPGTLEGAPLPAGSDEPVNRGDMRRAVRLLSEAGWTVRDGVLKDAAGTPFGFEILLAQGAGEPGQVVDIYLQSLARLGIVPTVSTVDAAQYVLRTEAYDFGMAWYTRALSLSPGNEQRLYWGSEVAGEPGSRNWMGIRSPAVDRLIAHLGEATEPAEFTATVQALDRVLTAGRWVIPVWYSPVDRIAHKARLHHPDRLPLYGDWPGFLPDVWWSQ